MDPELAAEGPGSSDPLRIIKVPDPDKKLAPDPELAPTPDPTIIWLVLIGNWFRITS
jgi:hypothetical protein